MDVFIMHSLSILLMEIMMNSMFKLIIYFYLYVCFFLFSHEDDHEFFGFWDFRFVRILVSFHSFTWSFYKHNKKIRLWPDSNVSFENEESFQRIRAKYLNESFSFKPITRQDIISSVESLPSDTPLAILKDILNIFSATWTLSFNERLGNNIFPDKQKRAEI